MRNVFIRSSKAPWRSFLSGDVLYWAARVEYWMDGALWLFSRNFERAADAERWMREKSAALSAAGPETTEPAVPPRARTAHLTTSHIRI